MIGAGAIQGSAARTHSITERILARRQERSANEPPATRRDDTVRPAQPQETERSKADARAVSLSFSLERAAAARFTEQSLKDAGIVQSNRANEEGARAAQAADEAKTAEAKDVETAKSTSAAELTDEEKAVVQELKARDREVRSHERAHKAVGGPHAGAISYVFQAGPDGQRYAVGGEVPIDVSSEKSPEATIQKMNTVISAALAPADPSGQDQAVARAAQAQRNQAIAELRAQKTDEREALATGGDEAEPGGDVAPNALAAVSAQESIYDLLRTLVEGAEESRLSKTA